MLSFTKNFFTKWTDIRMYGNPGIPEDSNEKKTYFLHLRSNHYDDVMLSG